MSSQPPRLTVDLQELIDIRRTLSESHHAAQELWVKLSLQVHGVNPLIAHDPVCKAALRKTSFTDRDVTTAKGVVTDLKKQHDAVVDRLRAYYDWTPTYIQYPGAKEGRIFQWPPWVTTPSNGYWRMKFPENASPAVYPDNCYYAEYPHVWFIREEGQTRAEFLKLVDMVVRKVDGRHLHYLQRWQIQLDDETERSLCFGEREKVF